MNKITHLHIKQQRFIGILDIEGVKISVFRDHAHIRLITKMLSGRFHTDHIFRAVRLSGNQVGGTEIHILDGRGENHVYGLVVSDFQTMRRYHPAEAYLAAQPLEIISATLLRIRSHEARQ